MDLSFVRLTKAGEPGPDNRRVYCDDDGVFIGPGCALIQAETDLAGRKNYKPRPQSEIARLLDAAHVTRFGLDALMSRLNAIAKALDDGDLGLAWIGALQLGLPELADGAAVSRMAAADRLLKAGFNPDEPRDWHGRWTTGGSADSAALQDPPVYAQAATGAAGVTGRPRDQDQATLDRAAVIYGETAGLKPALLNRNGSLYDPANWDPASADRLATARMYIGIVSERNPDVWSDWPTDPDNPIQAQAWNLAMDAAVRGADGTQLDSRITNFFMRQEGVGPQAPNWPGSRRYLSLGPFYNVGGGAAPAGPETYIDFYGE